MDTNKTKKQPKILASISRRLMAKIIDCVLAVLIFLVVRLIAEYMATYFQWVTPKVIMFSPVCAALGYLLLSDALPNGQSIAKRLLSIAVIDKKSGLACTVSQSFTRNAGAFIVIDWVWIFLESRTRLGDMYAKTIVVQTGRLQGKVRSLSDIYDDGKSESGRREQIAVTTMVENKEPK